MFSFNRFCVMEHFELEKSLTDFLSSTLAMCSFIVHVEGSPRDEKMFSRSVESELGYLMSDRS